MRTVGSSKWKLDDEGRGAKLLGWLLLPLGPLITAWHFCFHDYRLSHRRFMTREGWRSYHSEWRFANGLFCYLGPPSFVMWNIRFPMLANLAVSVGVAAWSQSGMPAIEQDHMPNLWSLGNFALALLLAFRLRAAYERWWSARTAFDQVCSQVAILSAQFSKYCRDRRLVADCARWCIVWQYGVLHNSTGAPALHPTAIAQLTEEEMELMAASTRTRVTAANKVRRIIVEAGLSEGEKQAIELAWRSTYEHAATCARIALTGFPYSVSLFTTGFLTMWTLFLPLSYLGFLTWWGILPIFIVALLLLGIDEVSTQLEDPWELLPLLDLLNGGVTDIRACLREDDAWAALEGGGCAAASRTDSGSFGKEDGVTFDVEQGDEGKGDERV